MSHWPWSTKDKPRPAPAPAPPAERVELTAAGMNVLWQAKADQINAIIGDALKQHGHRRSVPLDVLLDIQLTLAPPKPLRPAVPVIPGPYDR